MNIEDLLSHNVNLPEIKSAVSWASGIEENMWRLWSLAQSDDKRTSSNALWTMTHLPVSDSEWLSSLRDQITSMLLKESDTGKKRMLLQILRRQDFNKDDLRTDLLDFCMSKINSECEPYAIRCFSLYVAFNMCRHYPELVDELDEHLDMLEENIMTLSPGVRSALRQTKTNISKLRKNDYGRNQNRRNKTDA